MAALMADRQINNNQMADCLGIHRNTISRLKRRRTMPRIAPDRIEAICRALDCTPGELIEMKDD